MLQAWQPARAAQSTTYQAGIGGRVLGDRGRRRGMLQNKIGGEGPQNKAWSPSADVSLAVVADQAGFDDRKGLDFHSENASKSEQARIK